MESIVEVSFKVADKSQPAASRETLLTLLSGWLRSEDLLKTELVLDRYRASWLPSDLGCKWQRLDN